MARHAGGVSETVAIGEEDERMKLAGEGIECVHSAVRVLRLLLQQLKTMQFVGVPHQQGSTTQAATSAKGEEEEEEEEAMDTSRKDKGKEKVTTHPQTTTTASTNNIIGLKKEYGARMARLEEIAKRVKELSTESIEDTMVFIFFTYSLLFTFR